MTSLSSNGSSVRCVRPSKRRPCQRSWPGSTWTSPAVVIDGVEHRKVLRCEETYFGASGTIRVERSLYSRRQAGERTVCPLELRAGLVEGRWTPLAAKQGEPSW